jgi:8-oxo-dGTP pyrophosphatase MutT (NUDIX family)
MTNNPWKVKNSQIIYENPWISVSHKEVITPNQTEGIYGVVHFKNLAIGIIVLDEHFNTYIVGQYRFPLNKYSWEIPEGGGPLNELPLEAAKRELMEETGIVAKKWTKIVEMDLSNSATDEHAIIFLAQELSFKTASPDETEKLEVKKIPFDVFFNEVYEGQHQDSLTVAAVLKVKLMMMLGEI